MGKSRTRRGNSSGSPETQARKREAREQRTRTRRRKRFTLAGSIAIVVVAVIGAVSFTSGQRERRAHDLSGVGAGVPAVVQVHDTTCPFCTELRNNIRGIESDFSDDALLIRVADVHTEDGLAFARRYTSQRRVTLLYLDGAGELVDVEVGVQEPEALRRTFERHAATAR